MTTTTTTTTPSQQQQQQQQNALNDDGHYANIHDVDEPSGHHDYFEFNQPTSDDDAVDQRQRPPDNYERLDPSVLATLRRPAAPSVYARLSPNTSVASGVTNTEDGDRNPTNHETVDPASLNESSVSPDYAGVSNNLQLAWSHDYWEDHLLARPAVQAPSEDSTYTCTINIIEEVHKLLGL